MKTDNPYREKLPTKRDIEIEAGAFNRDWLCIFSFSVNMLFIILYLLVFILNFYIGNIVIGIVYVVGFVLMIGLLFMNKSIWWKKKTITKTITE